MSRKLTSLVLVLLLATTMLAGCNTTGGTTPAAADTKVVIGYDMSPKNLDPRLARDVATHSTVNLIFDSLFRLDKNMEVQPWLVEDVKIENDRIYTLKIKKGVKFHDGTELTAHDVKFTVDTIMDPELASPALSDFRNVKRVEVLDTHTIQFELENIYVRFLGSLSFGIVSEKAVKELGDDYGIKPIGSGAYKLTDWQVDQNMTLTAHDDWFKGKPNIKTVEFQYIPEAATRLANLEAGFIDIMTDGFTPADIARLEKSDRLTVGRAIATNYEYIGFNFDKELANNEKVRQAIAYALDKDAITRHFEGYRTYTSLPPNNWAYRDNVNRYELNVAKAKELLTEAGYPNGLTIPLKTSPGRAELSQIIKDQLRAINVEVDIQQVESATYFADLAAGNMVMYVHGWTGQTDPDQFTIFHSSQKPPAGANRANYVNTRVDELYEIARRTVSRDERIDIYNEAHKIMIDEAAFIPLYTSAFTNVYNNKIQGLEVAPFPVTVLASLPFATVNK